MDSAILWDYHLSEIQFLDLLNGKDTIGRLDATWATIRLLEYGSYSDIVKYLGFKRLIHGWPNWRNHIRSLSRRRSFDFLTAWLPAHSADWENYG